MQREFEERRRLENEEAMMRTFIAQPILIEDPILHPEKVRKPLTKVQEFNVHVDHRAPDRAEFDKKEKEMMNQRYREEAEATRMMEEDMALKQLRKTLVIQTSDNLRSPKFVLKRQERRIYQL
ncbi:protein TPX2-like [Solanum pennellii]|uniref:Protein TPX2-like n=1 Tax=Solanum pennellii TaxID=28526 RepID=A0ABM1V0P4_SOLPN|nr:protein TPX2-like [Solanum pennellii]XP_015061657.1 protein TPX2-like [Solanum pennellii]XP_027769312.1 protein TPX2-like [Solanum pennellii]